MFAGEIVQPPTKPRLTIHNCPILLIRAQGQPQETPSCTACIFGTGELVRILLTSFGHFLCTNTVLYSFKP